MKRKIGTIFMICGVALILSALSLFGYNQWEAFRADRSAQDLLSQLSEQIPENANEPDPPLGTPVDCLDASAFDMTELNLDGNTYIGCLYIPALDLKLPVMSEWSYPNLRISPCRYCGSVRGEDLVLLAHNYPAHFGRLKELTDGDVVYFTDMDGVTYEYTVVGKDILNPTDWKEMTAGEYDLTLFTCTIGGASRVTIYCDLNGAP